MSHSLATSSLLKAVGVDVGSAGTAGATAAVKWITKDGIGALGRLLVPPPRSPLSRRHTHAGSGSLSLPLLMPPPSGEHARQWSVWRKSCLVESRQGSGVSLEMKRSASFTWAADEGLHMGQQSSNQSAQRPMA